YKGSHNDDFPSLPAMQRPDNTPEHQKQSVTLAPTSGEVDLKAEFEKFKRNPMQGYATYPPPCLL
ncbi:hypothetical protein BG004_005942, partial [Podila humilis]